MSVHDQSEGKKGSLKWIQRLINEKQHLLDGHILKQLSLSPGSSITWISPIKPNFTEYRDDDFLKAVGHPELIEKLKTFWPKNGPQWDALGVTSDGTVILVEAKAHIAEILTSSGAKDSDSIKMIKSAFKKVREDLKINTSYPWNAPFYQYANRIAHLHFLHNMCGTQAVLVFVHFLGDEEMDGPRSKTEWHQVNRKVHEYLGLTKSSILNRVIDAFIDVTDLELG